MLRRLIVITVIAILVGLTVATSLFVFDLTGSMSKDAAFEAYVRFGNSALLPPNSINRTLGTLNPVFHLPEWEFFTLIWLRQRSNALLGLISVILLVPICVSVIDRRKSNTAAVK